MSVVIERLNNFIPTELQQGIWLDGNTFFKFDLSFVTKLFECSDYQSSVVTASSVDECLQRIDTGEVDNTKVLIIVSDQPPPTDHVIIDNNIFDLRVVCVLKSTVIPTNANSFQAIWYMRYGNGYNSWWKQERKNHVCTQCENDIDICQELNWNIEDHFFAVFLYLCLCRW